MITSKNRPNIAEPKKYDIAIELSIDPINTIVKITSTAITIPETPWKIATYLVLKSTNINNNFPLRLLCDSLLSPLP